MINSAEVLKLVEQDKINQDPKTKNKRGRPKKTTQLTTNAPKIKIPINNNEEENEIIIHFPFSKSDMALLKMDKLNLEEIKDDGYDETIREGDDSDNEENEENDSSDNEYITNDKHLRQFGLLIRKLKEENDELKKYLTEITPMYFTEIKNYPIDLKLFDNTNNVLVPKKTNICCWWCTYQFDVLPTYLPDKYSKECFYVSGCFCSFNCAGAYNLNLNDNKVWERYSLLKLLYYMINKDKINSITDIEINIAGPKELLEKYGGPMKIDDYRKNSKILGREYHKLMPPFIPLSLAYEETTNNKISGKNMNINNLINNSRNNFNNIVIKRNKPNHSVSQHIDKFIE